MSVRGLVGGSAALLAAAAVAASGAGAAAAAAGSATSLCGVARGVARELEATTSLSATKAMTPTRLKAVYTTIVKAEPALLGAASGQQKMDLRKALVFVNLANTDLKKAGWRAAAVPPTALRQLIAAAQKAAPSFTRLDAYFKGTCHLSG